MAAAAALARLEQKQPRARGPTSQDSIRNQVRKELQAEATVSGSPEVPSTNMVTEPKEEGSTHLAVPGVYFTCPLTGATLRKDQRDACIKEAILSHFSTDPVAASIMKIHTFNKDRDRVKLGVDTIAKYLDNIHLHPEEEKYRKIKLQNKVFQERINCLEGTHEFFEAIGFQKMMLPVPDQEGAEEFYVLSEAILAQPQSLERHKEQLLSAEPVRAKLDRQRRVFRPSPLASQFDLPVDFFSLTAEEIKREQRLRSDAVERLSVLRTKAMREKEEQRELRKYTYTLLRVRLPNGCLLQGTFYARERLPALYAFVREALENDWLPFELLASGGQKLSEDENLALNECGLS
ncbi:PREDICTED: UBX domain-containing protein 6 isoform X2 [Galeopterus variegatus]|uniref:UBX domain-containing protein 6 isoform X2 n=1 Tax=Galeopterus variegatus TaxID=482537 RepID=A0ABM0RPV2_GALVR|nr:PREDICTED: UBX domain-containing protein 6 isoform X2 [Galeopterus variegatus]XP_008582643.1 PREDICTED: UBX domain-containing protein 6 isoform X2 [Galeopterus variegatus]